VAAVRDDAVRVLGVADVDVLRRADDPDARSEEREETAAAATPPAARAPPTSAAFSPADSPASLSSSEPADTTVTSVSSGRPLSRDAIGVVGCGSEATAASVAVSSRRWRTPMSRKMKDATLTPIDA
jgi:hypothetical protein